MFNLAVVGLAMWLLWVVVASFRDDFWAAKQELRAVVLSLEAVYSPTRGNRSLIQTWLNVSWQEL